MTDWAKLKLHPAVSIMPAMDDAQYDELLSSIHAHGLQVPIVTQGDFIIDGRHRWRAIGDLRDRGVDIAARFEEWAGEGDPLNYIVQINLARRHLTTAQRACVAFEFMQMLKARAAAQTDAPTNPDGTARNPDGAGRMRDVAAQMFGTSSRTVERVARLAREAPDLYLSLKSNDIPDAGNAERELRNRQWVAKQAARADAQDAPASPAAASHSRPKVRVGEWWAFGRHRLFVGDCNSPAFRTALPREVLAVVDPDDWDGGSALATTWLAEYAPVQAWLPWPGQLAACCAAAAHDLPPTHALSWALSCHVVGDQTTSPVGFGNWLPALVVAQVGRVLDKREGDFRTVKWREQDGDQPLYQGAKPRAMMRWLLELFTASGEPVIDPYAGYGGVLMACEDMGRQFVGAEKNELRAANLLVRWAQETGQEARRV